MLSVRASNSVFVDVFEDSFDYLMKRLLLFVTPERASIGSTPVSGQGLTVAPGRVSFGQQGSTPVSGANSNSENASVLVSARKAIGGYLIIGTHHRLTGSNFSSCKSSH